MSRQAEMTNGPKALAAASGALGALLLVASPASAHAGLPADGALDGVVHPLLGIDHLLAMVAVGVLAAMAASRRVAWITPLAFLGGMVLGGLVGFAGVEAPAVEVVIALSVISLGVLVVVHTDNTGLWLPVLAAAFGAAHGHAHGAELPAGAAPLAYLVGIVATTVVLHLSGTGIGLALRRAPVVRVAAGTLVTTAGVLLLAG
jgi:urease accessory protein